MFSDKNAHEFPEVGFPSVWKKTKTVTTHSAQTDPFTHNDEGCQVKYVEEVGTQTTQHASKTMLNEEEQEYYLKDPKFYKFLNKATRILETEQQRVFKSRAFIGIHPLDEDDSEKNVRKLHMLDATSSVSSRNNQEGTKQVTLCTTVNTL